MRLAYDHQIFGAQKYGGISRYFFELANNIATHREADVRIISPIFVNAYLSEASAHLDVQGHRMPAVRRTGRIYRTFNRLLGPPMTRAFRPDVVHETYYSARSSAPLGSKAVLTVFDMIHERFPDSFAPGDSTSDEKKAAVARADHIVCISDQTRHDLIELLDVNPAKTSVVHLGFSLTTQSGKRQKPIERPFLLYVGSRGGYKNFTTLLCAYAAKPELQRDYDLVAFGGGVLNAEERAQIDHLGIRAERVRQVGGNDAVLAALYSQAAAFVYPSRYEGFGIPPLEAMSFGCPVICSDASSIPEVVGNAGQFFRPDSSAALGDAIEQVLNDPSLRQTLTTLGRERIKLFSWARCAEKTMDVYRGILP